MYLCTYGYVQMCIMYIYLNTYSPSCEHMFKYILRNTRNAHIHIHYMCMCMLVYVKYVHSVFQSVWYKWSTIQYVCCVPEYVHDVCEVYVVCDM